MIVDGGVEPGQLTGVTQPPIFATEAEAVGPLRAVRRHLITGERVEPLSLLLGWEQTLSGAQRSSVDQQVLDRRDYPAGRPPPGRVPVSSVTDLSVVLALEGVALRVRIGKGRVRVGERGLLEAERFYNPFAVEVANRLAAHLLEDETEQHRVCVGVLKFGARIERRRVLYTKLHQLFGPPNPLRIGEKLILPLLVEGVAGDPAGHVRHLAQRNLITIRDALEVLIYRVIEREEPISCGLEEQADGEGLGDAADPLVHVG